MFGSISTHAMYSALSPRAFATCTNSSVLMLTASARAIRYEPGM